MKTIDLTDACRRVEALLARYGVRWSSFVNLQVYQARHPGEANRTEITYRLAVIVPADERGPCFALAGDSAVLDTALALLECELSAHLGVARVADLLAAVVVPEASA